MAHEKILKDFAAHQTFLALVKTLYPQRPLSIYLTNAPLPYFEAVGRDASSLSFTAVSPYQILQLKQEIKLPYNYL